MGVRIIEKGKGSESEKERRYNYRSMGRLALAGSWNRRPALLYRRDIF